MNRWDWFCLLIRFYVWCGWECFYVDVLCPYAISRSTELSRQPITLTKKKKDRLMMDENHRTTNGDGITTWCRRATYVILDFSLLQVFVDTQMAQVNSVRADKLTVREASLPVCLSSLCTREGTQVYTDPLMHVFLSCWWIIVHINIYNLWTYSGHTHIEITSDLFSSCSHAPLEVEGGYLHCRACQLFAWMPWFV